MKLLPCRCCWPFLAILAVTRAGRAEDPVQEGKIRVLLTVGGHEYEEEPFYAMFRSMPDVAYTLAHMPADAGLLKPGLEKQYDAIVMYDMVGGISPEQQNALVALLNRESALFRCITTWEPTRIGASFPRSSAASSSRRIPSLGARNTKRRYGSMARRSR